MIERQVEIPTAGGAMSTFVVHPDRWMPTDQIDVLKASPAGQPVKAEVEVFPGTEHGFAFPQRPVYKKAAAERHWERLHALFRRNLG